MAFCGIEIDGQEVRKIALVKGVVVSYEAGPEDLVVSAVHPTDVLLRRISVDVKQKKKIAAVRDFQVEPLLPLPLEEVVLDHILLEGDQLAVLSVPKTSVATHLDEMQDHGHNPERVSCAPVALAGLIEHLLPASPAQGILHLGKTATTCAVVQGGKVLATRSFGMGTDLFEPGTDFLTADPDQTRPGERLRTEIAKTFYALAAREKAPEIQQIFVTGTASDFSNLDAYIGQALDVSLSQPPSFPSCPDTAKYAVALGLALSAERPLIDFRKDEFAAPFPWRRLKKPLAALATLVFALTLSAFFLSNSLLSRKHAAVQAEYASLEALAGQPHDPLTKLPAEEILAKAHALDAELRAVPASFPLVPDIPEVSDLISWISSHPQPIQVEELHYRLVRRPDHKRPNEKYRVEVDLAFSAPSATIAREFRDRLREPNPLIDGDVQWNATSGKYLASFTLKDRTIYP